MSKNILVVKGSPRKQGNSTILADQVIAAAKAAGANVDSVTLQELEINACMACDSCQKSVEIDCIQQDDMQALYPKLRKLDALVLACPIYWFTMSAQMKLFIDRGFYALGGPGKHPLAGKQIGLVLTYADTDPFTSGAINALRAFQDMFRFIGAEIAGAVYGSAWTVGEIEKKPETLEKAYQLGQQLGSE